MIKRFSLFTLFLISFFLSFPSLASLPEVPKPFRYISDYTNTLSKIEQQELEQALKIYSTKTSSQIAVVLVPSTDGKSISDYTFKVFNKWGIGQKKQNNGVLFLIAKNDHKLFIAVGRGLEAALPDAITATIIRHNIVPFFKQNKYPEGIASGLSAIIKATQNEYKPKEAEKDDPFDGFFIFLGIGIILFIIFNIVGRKGRNYISPSHINRHSYGHNSFGSFGHNDNSFGGGSGFGSSSGFGGGSTGGGGAGGSW